MLDPQFRETVADGYRRSSSLIVGVSLLGGVLVTGLSTGWFSADSPAAIAIHVAVAWLLTMLVTCICLGFLLPIAGEVDPERGYERYSHVIACFTSVYCVVGVGLYLLYPETDANNNKEA